MAKAQEEARSTGIVEKTNKKAYVFSYFLLSLKKPCVVGKIWQLELCLRRIVSEELCLRIKLTPFSTSK